MALVWKTATVVEKKVWSEGLFTLRLDADVLPFEPGQFLQLGIEVDGKMINRPYSVASPHGTTLDFYIVLVESGELTPRLWLLSSGDSVKINERAAGSFTLSKSPPGKHLWLVSTGTGLAPYIAMLRTATPWERFEKIFVVHGVRRCSDLSYGQELCKYQSQNPSRMTYIPVVSRETCPQALAGRITNCLENGTLESRAGELISPDHSVFMLCGNPDMLDELEKMLEGRGLRKHRHSHPGHIVVERYW